MRLLVEKVGLLLARTVPGPEAATAVGDGHTEALQAADAAARGADEALAAAKRFDVLLPDEYALLLTRLRLATWSLEARRAVVDPGRPDALRDLKTSAQGLRKGVDDLVRNLSGDSDTDDDKSTDTGARILIFDRNTSAIKYSLIKRLKATVVDPSPPDWLLPVMEELLVTSLFRLRCLRWKGATIPATKLNAAACAVFEMQQERLERDHYGTRKPLRGVDPLDRAAFRASQEQRIKGELETMQSTGVTADALERQRLETLLSVLPKVKEAIEHRRAGAEDRLEYLVASQPAGMGRIVLEDIARGGSSWHTEFVKPPRVHRQNSLVRSRGVRMEEWIIWLRGVQFAARVDDGRRATDMLGSALSGDMPSSVNGTQVNVDHVVPQSWFTRSSQLHFNGSPVEDAVQCVLVLRSENSYKSNKPIFFEQTDKDYPDHPYNTLYRVSEKDWSFFTDDRKSVLARCIAYSFYCYALVSEGGSDGWKAFDETTGCKYFAKLVNEDTLVESERNDTLLRLVDTPVRDLESTNAL
eukprot:6580779-Prymnesium_polylepis.1